MEKNAGKIMITIDKPCVPGITSYRCAYIPHSKHIRAYEGRQFVPFLMVFGMTRAGGEPTTYRVRSGHVNH